MKQFKGLLKKEWNTYRNQFMIPLWIMVGLYVLMIIAVVIGLNKGGVITSEDLTHMPAGMNNFYLYTINLVMAIVASMFVLLSFFGIIDNIINEEFRKKCSIFHLAQPVQLWKILSAKFITVVGVGFILSLLISFVNATVFSIVYSIFTNSNIMYGYLAMIQGFILSTSTFVLITSTLWLLSSIFKEKGLLYGLISVVGIDSFIYIANYIYKMSIPAISKTYLNLALSNFDIGISTNNLNMEMLMKNLTYSGKLTMTIQEVWLSCLSGSCFIRLAVSAVFLLVGYWLYKRRDIM